MARGFRAFVPTILLKTALVKVTCEHPVVISHSQFSGLIFLHHSAAFSILIAFLSSIMSRWLLDTTLLLLLLPCWLFLLCLLCRFVPSSQSLKVGELQGSVFRFLLFSTLGYLWFSPFLPPNPISRHVILTAFKIYSVWLLSPTLPHNFSQPHILLLRLLKESHLLHLAPPLVTVYSQSESTKTC